MEHSLLNPIKSKEEMITAFTGYDHRITATEGSYYDMKNMTSDYYPAMSPRKERKSCNLFTSFQCMYSYDDVLVYVDNNKLYIDGVYKGVTFRSVTESIVKIGSLLVFFPDKKWYDTIKQTSGDLEASADFAGLFDFGWALQDGTVIHPYSVEPSVPHDGDYLARLEGGQPAIYQYSATSSTWNPISTIYTYIQSTLDDEFFANFNEGDGVKLTFEPEYLDDYKKKNIYINKENNGCLSAVFTIIKKPDNSTIVIPVNSGSGASITFNTSVGKENSIKRLLPSLDISSIFECQNRLWGGSPDGHEIYSCKLGDPSNWNVFQGISTDSWAATVGSDGEFTGGINYQGIPVFFKEKSILKISISSVGGHSYKETVCRGVAPFCGKSLVMIGALLYYKSADCFCVYDGSFPQELPDVFCDLTSQDEVTGGVFRDKYYVALRKDQSDTIFSYDTKYGIWMKEDFWKWKKIMQFCSISDQLYFADSDVLYSVENIIYLYDPRPAKENAIDWEVVSNDIGYLYIGRSHSSRINAKKYIQKMIMQVSLTIGSHLSVYINYDSSDQWEFLYNFSGTTTSLCKLPIRPHRCNHFRYKIVGHGDAKIYSITKYYVEGSDV